jgi:S1-C subfamily serine protease
VGEQRIADRRALYRALWKHRAGEKIRITVMRRDAVTVVSVDSQDRAEFYY